MLSGVAALAALATTGAALPPQTFPAPSALGVPLAPAADAPIQTAEDAAARMTVPVMIDGKGPFPFVVDTGADRTVISRELAATLGLPADSPVLVHDTGGDDVTATARIADLAVGGRHMTDIAAPTLSAVNLGAMGMLGIDALHGQRMVIDFRHKTLSVEPSVKEKREPGVIVVHARSRYGQLILVDAAIGNQPIDVILDTGAQNTIGNSVLERVVGHVGVSAIRLGGDVVSVTGRTTPAFFSELPHVQIGGVDLHNQPVAFADLHTFAQFKLTRAPAMLLGMDTLRVFDKVVIDFGRKEVRFKLAEAPAPGLVMVADAR
jgi:predicted aspartyl protease